jgi:hypothetical protein
MNDTTKPTDAWPSPSTDPTNPCSQEAVGLWAASERGNENRVDEPGLTDDDRLARSQGRSGTVTGWPPAGGSGQVS